MYIYKTTCLVNGKIYIGQCNKEPIRTQNYLGSGTNIKRAIVKYGKHNFTKEILKDNILNQKLLDTWEQVYIIRYKSIDARTGYNIIAGTSNGFGSVNPATLPEVREKMRLKRIGVKSSDATKAKLSKIHKGKVFSEETKDKLRIAYYENTPPHLYSNESSMRGKKHSEETKIKIGNKRIGKKMTEENRLKLIQSNIDRGIAFRAAKLLDMEDIVSNEHEFIKIHSK